MLEDKSSYVRMTAPVIVRAICAKSIMMRLTPSEYDGYRRTVAARLAPR